MDIDQLTFGDAKKIAAMVSGAPAETFTTPHIGKKCIIRTYASGVHFGTVIAHSDRTVELGDARRLWRFQAKEGISLSAVATNGLSQNKSKVCEAIPSMTILDALEIIPVSSNALASIEGAPVAAQS